MVKSCIKFSVYFRISSKSFVYYSVLRNLQPLAPPYILTSIVMQREAYRENNNFVMCASVHVM